MEIRIHNGKTGRPILSFGSLLYVCWRLSPYASPGLLQHVVRLYHSFSTMLITPVTIHLYLICNHNQISPKHMEKTEVLLMTHRHQVPKVEWLVWGGINITDTFHLSTWTQQYSRQPIRVYGTAYWPWSGWRLQQTLVHTALWLSV